MYVSTIIIQSVCLNNFSSVMNLVVFVFFLIMPSFGVAHDSHDSVFGGGGAKTNCIPKHNIFLCVRE